MSEGPTLRLILGDQLNPLHRWFGEVCVDVVYVLMEVRNETDYVRHHAQKVLGIFAAMRDFARQLKAAGHRAHFQGNSRLGVVYHQLARMPNETLTALKDQAARTLASLSTV